MPPQGNLHKNQKEWVQINFQTVKNLEALVKLHTQHGMEAS